MTKQTSKEQHPYVGMWVAKDGYIRHELLPNGRYDEARGNRTSAYQGSYTITGNHIDYVDDTGFTADGAFFSLWSICCSWLDGDGTVFLLPWEIVLFSRI